MRDEVTDPFPKFLKTIHYLNQCLLFTNQCQSYYPGNNFTVSTRATIYVISLKNVNLKLLLHVSISIQAPSQTFCQRHYRITNLCAMTVNKSLCYEYHQKYYTTLNLVLSCTDLREGFLENNYTVCTAINMPLGGHCANENLVQSI